MAEVLLLGNNDRSTLTACRSLGRQGIAVDILGMGERSAAGYSRYARKLYELGDPTDDVQSLIDKLETFLSEKDYSLIIPLSDPSCQICLVARTMIESYSPIALPSDEAFAYAFDKGLLVEKCQELGIPTPDSTVVTSENNLPKDFPCYLKPVHSAVIQHNQIRTFGVKKVRSKSEFQNFIRECGDGVRILSQQECVGKGVGVYLIANHGKILSASQQNRLHEPRDGGGSSYRMTVPLDPALHEYTERLIEAIRWTGVAMLEFKEDSEKGCWSVMELNGRFWGSLALTVESGLDYPYWLYQLWINKDQTIGRYVTPSLGKRQRHLGKDLKWLAKGIQGKKGGEVKKWISDLRHIWTGKEKMDIESLLDPGPGLAYWVGAGGAVTERIVNRVRRPFFMMQYIKKERELTRQFTTLCRLGQPKLLFVCRGNICRSPFAEQYCRQRLGYDQVKSAGTFPKRHRRVTTDAEFVAQQGFGVDLTKHRSQLFDNELVEWADVILVMDFKNYAEIKKQTEKKRQFVILLGSVGNIGEISDPYGKNQQVYQETYEMISKNIDRVLKYGKISIQTR